MEISISSYSFQKYMSADSLGYLGILDKAKAFGAAGIEYNYGDFMKEPDAAKRIKDRAGELGLTVVALAVPADFINDPDAAAKVKGCVDFTAEMGALRLRHDITSGFKDRKLCRGYDDALPLVVPAVREIADYAEQKGVGTMTENHGYFSQDAARVEKLINAVAHKNFGALVDVGNFMCADEDPARSVSILAPYAVHVHAKDFHRKDGMLPNPGKGWFQTRAGNYLRGAIIGHGEAKVAQSIRVLKKTGYKGYVTVEFEGLEDPLLGIEYGIENLRAMIDGGENT